MTASDLEMYNRVISTNDKASLREVWPDIGPIMDAQPGFSLHYFQLVVIARSYPLESIARTFCLSCWHDNPQESDAMWALYSQRDAGIAIKSTVHRVLDAFANSGKFMYIGKVNYDSQNSLSSLTPGLCDPLLVKRHAFYHENEVRIIAYCPEGYDPKKNVPPGVYVDCEIESLIEEVVISPLAPTYTADAIETIIEKFTPSISVRRSNLLSRKDLIPFERLSPELRSIQLHYWQTGHIRDFDELNLSQEALNALRSRKSLGGPA